MKNSALSKYEPSFWIELEQNYFASLSQRKALLQQQGTNILNYFPDAGSTFPCRELMEMDLQNLWIDAPIQRGAWFIEDWKPLYVTPEQYALNSGTRYSASGEKVPIEQCYLRVDWQTLRRLPLSEMRDEPYIPSLLYKQVTEGKPLITEPKVHKHLLPVVLGKLKEWREEQVEGLIVEGWEEETLRESPFYPGWEGKWRERAGFEI
ncbi:hypothetical protein BDV06DRAFT_221497 [Aspergillus oleicola]